MASTITLHADGTYHEKISFRASPDQSDSYSVGKRAKKSKEANGNPVDKAFSFDRKAAKITKSTGDSEDEVVLTLQRDFAPGKAPHIDANLLSDDAKALVTSKVDVRKLANGDIQLDVSIKRRQMEPLTIDPKIRLAVKKSMPPRFASSTATIDGLTQELENSMLRALFGPPYPEFFEMIGVGEAAHLHLGSAVKAIVDQGIPKYLPGLTDGENKACVHRLLKALDIKSWTDGQKKANDPTGTGASGKESPGMNEFASFLYEVAFDGTVVETNGLTDPISGHVYWSLYALSTAWGDAKLHLIVRPG